jgi:hypothetical protein
LDRVFTDPQTVRAAIPINMMASVSPTTRFASVSRRQALFIVGATAVAIAWCLVAAVYPSDQRRSRFRWDGEPETEALAPADGSDLRLYRRVVECVHAGEDYYEAAGREMRAAGYPTGSIFNWRPPLYAWLVGLFPTPTWAQVVLGIIALVAMFLACALMGREGGIGRVAAGILPLVGALYWCIDGDAFLSQELWAGILIALSICLFAQDRWRLGLATGLSALFLRELALPYCLICLLSAWRQRRGEETIIWLIGVILYAVCMLLHGMAVRDRILPADRVHASWVQFGGAAFLLLTCRMNAYLFNAPLWLSAVYLPLALLGLAAWRGWTGARLALTAGVYVAAFAVVGQPFNDYWGLMNAPLLAFGIAAVPEALLHLYLAIRGQ